MRDFIKLKEEALSLLEIFRFLILIKIIISHCFQFRVINSIQAMFFLIIHLKLIYYLIKHL